MDVSCHRCLCDHPQSFPQTRRSSCPIGEKTPPVMAAGKWCAARPEPDRERHRRRSSQDRYHSVRAGCCHIPYEGVAPNQPNLRALTSRGRPPSHAARRAPADYSERRHALPRLLSNVLNDHANPAEPVRSSCRSSITQRRTARSSRHRDSPRSHSRAGTVGSLTRNFDIIRAELPVADRTR